MNNQYQIETLTSADFSIWDDYVKSHALGTFFHLSGWQTVIQNSFGHACYFLVAKDNGRVCGVLPLVEVKSALFGHALVSTPFCVYGGTLLVVVSRRAVMYGIVSVKKERYSLFYLFLTM